VLASPATGVRLLLLHVRCQICSGAACPIGSLTCRYPEFFMKTTYEHSGRKQAEIAGAHGLMP